MSWEVGVFLVAVVLDLLLGDPPSRFHPTAWIGKGLAALDAAGRRLKRDQQFFYGLVVALALPALVWILAAQVLQMAGKVSAVAQFVLEVFLLKSAFSVRMLAREAQQLRRSLRGGGVQAARKAMRSLVSRKAGRLTKRQLISGGVESVAENTTDAFLAPWFWYVCFGTGGALAYRAVNTLDSMWGYHGSYERLGKAGARLDDFLNILPSRLAAVLLAAACGLWHGRGWPAWRTALRQHGRTESPNAGWTMAAMAGGLGVRLEKTGCYVLGEAERGLEPGVIDESVRVMLTVAAAAAIMIILCLLWR